MLSSAVASPGNLVLLPYMGKDLRGIDRGKCTSHQRGPNRWEDESLGWFPEQKGEYTQFANTILPGFYHSFWENWPYWGSFGQEFIQERKRQWDNKESIKKITLKVSFLTSDNPTAAGRFMQENFEVKRHDSITIINNPEKLRKVKSKIEELELSIRELSDGLLCLMDFT